MPWACDQWDKSKCSRGLCFKMNPLIQDFSQDFSCGKLSSICVPHSVLQHPHSVWSVPKGTWDGGSWHGIFWKLFLPRPSGAAESPFPWGDALSGPEVILLSPLGSAYCLNLIKGVRDRGGLPHRGQEVWCVTRVGNRLIHCCNPEKVKLLHSLSQHSETFRQNHRPASRKNAQDLDLKTLSPKLQHRIAFMSHNRISVNSLHISHVRQLPPTPQFPPNVLPNVAWAVLASLTCFSYLSDLISS